MSRQLARSAVLVLAVLAGCGIGASERVEEIEPDELAALDPTTTTSSTTTIPTATSEPSDSTLETGLTGPPDSGPIDTPEVSTIAVPATTTTVKTEDIELYFINGSQLVAIATPVPAWAGLAGRLRGLESGPPSEVDDGIRTAVPVGLIGGVLISGDQTAVTVDLDSELLESVEVADQQPMVAQIVLSLTGGLGYREVRFTRDDVPMRVFRRDNLLSEPGEPVTWADYEALLEGEASRSGATSTTSR